MVRRAAKKAIATRSDLAKKRARARASVRPPSTESNAISIKGGVFTYDGAVMEQPLPVIILDEIVEFSYYEGDYDEDKVQSPVCYAYSEPISTCTADYGGNMEPHEKSSKKQNAQCDGCWANEFESAARGKGKACGNRRKLLVMAAFEGSEKQDIAIIRVPPSGLRLYNAYVRQLDRLHDTVPEFVVTHLTLEKTKPTDIAAVPRYQYVKPISDEQAASVDEIIRINRDVLLSPFSDPREDKPVTKKTAPRKKAPARKKTAAKRRAK